MLGGPVLVTSQNPPGPSPELVRCSQNLEEGGNTENLSGPCLGGDRGCSVRVSGGSKNCLSFSGDGHLPPHTKCLRPDLA
eukprot:2954952-Alexandrium_andersonii.AAC.1